MMSGSAVDVAGEMAATPSQPLKLSLFPLSFLLPHVNEPLPLSLFLHRDDFPRLKRGDVVQISHPTDDGANRRMTAAAAAATAGKNKKSAPRMLLQVGRHGLYHPSKPKVTQSPLSRDTVYVEKSVAEAFGLKNFMNVVVTPILDLDSIALDSVELTFKDTYLGRSEMWRIKELLLGQCVHVAQRVDLCQGSVRCQVNETWGQGERVACGLVTSDTKVVFRSHSTMIYLFIQMSSEMWHKDAQGNLYYELAVEGFLSEMFERWKRCGSSHEVTIVLFSRCFYDAKTKEEFPKAMQDCLQKGYEGEFYEDFYRVVVQNERFDDWTPTLLELRQIFTDYKRYVFDYHKNANYAASGADAADAADTATAIPTGRISSAEQGNFLEVLNMSLTTFENHYLNRNLDRTGQQSIVITPGVGIFEVDRELTQVTKQRIIDSGVGSDLICLGEQPLHAVPLLKFVPKDDDEDEHGEGQGQKNAKRNARHAAEDYSMPHWINLSFYTCGKKLRAGNFRPRIKLPPKLNGNQFAQRPKLLTNNTTAFKDADADSNIGNYIDNLDSYDSEVFPAAQNGSATSTLERHVSADGAGLGFGLGLGTIAVPASRKTSMQVSKRKMSIPEVAGNANGDACVAKSYTQDISSSMGNSLLFNNLAMGSLLTSTTDKSLTDGGGFDHQTIKRFLLRPGRALVNPFDPSQTTVRVTSNRRRWTHIFPKGPTGNYQQVHHQMSEAAAVVASRRVQLQSKPSRSKLLPSALATTPGEQEWAPSVTTGVDWKSLTIPASLPITTDYFPEKRTFVDDYLVNENLLKIDDLIADYGWSISPIPRQTLSSQMVFSELVSQRLSQGFQRIVLPSKQETPLDNTLSDLADMKLNESTMSLASNPVASPTSAANNAAAVQTEWLSIGRIFHKIMLTENPDVIHITVYCPRDAPPNLGIEYRYRFQAPDNDTYDISWVEFHTEKLENFPWNNMDYYICTRGHRDFLMTENLKYWRLRFYLIPIQPYMNVTKSIVEKAAQSDTETGCDLYRFKAQELKQDWDASEAFARFIDLCINRLKRQPKAGSDHHKNSTPSLSSVTAAVSAASTSPACPFCPSAPAPDPDPAPAPAPELEVTSTPPISPPASVGSPRLRLESGVSAICKVMQCTSCGVSLYHKAAHLPSMTFLSLEAVSWLQCRIEDIHSVDQAVELLQSMLQQKFIRHASGDPYHPFLYGYFFYTFVPSSGAESHFHYRGDTESFQSDFVEVKIIGEKQETTYKTSTVDVDHLNRSDRIEWAHLMYQSGYQPPTAYELTLQWLVSTGAVMTDLVQGWSRKVQQQCGFALVPVPGDPFALPITLNSDPVRGPIFVELSDSFMYAGNLPEDDRFDECLLRFREAIARRFGFVTCGTDPRQQRSSSLFSTDYQYIHCTGNMFLLIPTQIHMKTAGGIQGIKTQQAAAAAASEQAGPAAVAAKGRNNKVGSTAGEAAQTKEDHKQKEEEEEEEACITRHLSETKPEYDPARTGFLWSWNFMISRRWKQLLNTGATGDIQFMDKMLSDFRSFCQDENGRLQEFWQEFCQKNNYS